MSIFLSTFRVIRFTFQNIFRNFWLSFVSLTIFVLTLLTVNAVLFVNVIADATLESVRRKVEVTIYFTDETSEDIALAAQGYMMGLPQVRDVTYVSKEEMLASFIEANANDELVLASLNEVDGNPFGHSLVITAESSDDFPFILEVIETPEFSPSIKEKDTSDYDRIIQGIRDVSWKVRAGGVVLAGFFTLVAMLIIFNTIRVAIYVHREEIGIMKLVGANDWFVRGPFILEALLYSFVATALMVGIVALVLGTMEPWILRFFGDIQTSAVGYFWENGLWIFVAQWLGLSALSLLTTFIAMRRYLRV
ncbi:MAG: permease-like cell division protein FtsX [Patescibacteria group bacterium]|jgi:cell division transport system permease protein